MMERQLPGPIPRDEFFQTIEAFEHYVGSDWLSAQPPDASPLAQVWNRVDYLSSLELFTVADSYRQMAPRTDAEWLAHYRSALRSHNAKDILSQTYELMSAAMFSYGHDVKLCRPSYHGYDFTVADAGKTVRVSCKKLGPSDGERKFREQARQIYEHVRATATRLRTPSFQVVLELFDPENRFKLTLGELQSGITNQLVAYRGGPPVRRGIGGWRLTIAPLHWGPDNRPVDRDYASHIFIYIAPHAQDEQRRFADRFKEAAQKLKIHGQPINDDNVNVVMIGLPPAVSLDTATRWLRHKFSRDNSSVSAVLLNRPMLASSADMSSISFQYEMAFVTNPNAKITWNRSLPRGFTNSLKVPIGSLTETESYPALNLGGELIKLKDKYTFQRGEINLEAGPAGKEMKINYFEAFGIWYNVVVRDQDGRALGITVPTPPDNALVLL